MWRVEKLAHMAVETAELEARARFHHASPGLVWLWHTAHGEQAMMVLYTHVHGEMPGQTRLWGSMIRQREHAESEQGCASTRRADLIVLVDAALLRSLRFDLARSVALAPPRSPCRGRGRRSRPWYRRPRPCQRRGCRSSRCSHCCARRRRPTRVEGAAGARRRRRRCGVEGRHGCQGRWQ